MKAIFMTAVMLITNNLACAQCLTYGEPSARIVFGTGLAVLDQDIQLEAERLEKAYGVTARLKFIDDGTSPNAFANPAGFVYMGIHLLDYELHDPQGGPTSIVGIEAHEFAHILQAAHGSQLRGSQLELHADFMAGWYLARQYKKRALRPKEFARSLYDKGDSDFYSPQHHGTPQQRVAAMLAGYQSVHLSAGEAFDKGEGYVSTLR